MTPATFETDTHPSGRKPIVELLQEALDTPLPSLDPVSQTTSPIASITSHPPASSKSSFARTNDGLKSPPIAHFEDHHHYTAQRSASKTATAPEPHPNTYKHCELALDNTNNNNSNKDQSSSDSMAVFRPGATPTLLQTLNKARPSLSNVKRQPQVLVSHHDQVLGRRSPNAVGHDTPSSLRGTGTRNDGGQDQGDASTPYMQAEATRAALHELEDRAEQSTVAEKYLPAFIQPSNWEMQNVNPFTNLLTSNPFSKLGESSNRGTPTGTSPRPSLRRRRNHRSNSASLLETVSRETQPTVASMLDYDANRSDASCSHTHGRKTSFGARPRPASMEALRAASPTPTSWFDGPALFPRPPTPAFGNSWRSFHSASKRSAPSLWKWFDGGGSSSKSSSGKRLTGSEAAETPQRDASAKKHAHKHMLDESDKRDSVEKEEEHIKRKYSAPKNPVVFCHGLLGFDYIGPKGLPALQISHWRGILEVLQENGVELMIAKVPATSSAAQRAEILVKAIEEKFAGRQVNLVGHSMGGLDGRYLISKLKPTTFKVVSLTTISTPHRGSSFADYFIDNIIGREKLPSWLTVLDTISLGAAGDGSAFQALTTRSMKLFNEQVVDDPNVKYYSWGASYSPGWFDPMRWSHDVIESVEGENDGLVSVESSKWGEFQGVLVGCSHVDLVGWVNHVRFTMEAWAGRPIAFKPATFYLEISDFLAKQGF